VSAPAAPAEPRGASLRSAFSGGKLVPVVAPAFFVALFIVYSFWLGDAFLDSNSRILDLHQNVPVLLIALGLTVCLVAGQFDLSVASMATLTAFLAIGLPTQQGWPIGLALLACLGVAILGGLFNALLVVRLQVNAFIATLGSGGVFLGLSAVYSNGTSLIPNSATDAGVLPSWFTGPDSLASFQSKAPAALVFVFALVLIGGLLATGWERTSRRESRLAVAIGCGALVALVGAAILFGELEVPWTVMLLFFVTFVLWVLLRYTVLGRHLYALGGNVASARLAGVKVDRSTTIVFVMAAVLAGLAGVVLAANQGAASPGSAVPYLLPAFAAGFLSTVLFANGRFHVWGTLLGGYLIVTVSQGLVTGGVPFTWNDVVNGLVLIGAVSFQSYFTGTRRRGARGRRTERSAPGEPRTDEGGG
jgi:ribose/xylose/arabinose/galactoside ABC-type transport system permease subunit